MFRTLWYDQTSNYAKTLCSPQYRSRTFFGILSIQIQHIHNGKVLRRRYIERHNFLRNALQDRKQLQKAIHAVTTTRTRTMQSAVGFLYGLLPDFHLYEVRLWSVAEKAERTALLAIFRQISNILQATHSALNLALLCLRCCRRSRKRCISLITITGPNLRL